MDAAVPATPQQNAPALVTGKTFGIRAVAYVIDAVIATVVNLVMSICVGFIIGVALSLIGQRVVVDPQPPVVLSFVVGLIVSAFYYTIFESLYGASPGKLILGLRVVMANGEPCGFWPAFKRAWLRYFDGLFFGLVALGSMKPPLYQRVGDKSAQTIVVGSKDAIILRPRAWWRFLIAVGVYLGVSIVQAAFLVIVQLR